MHRPRVPIWQDFGKAAVGIVGVIPCCAVYLGSDEFVGGIVTVGGRHRAGTEILLEFEHVARRVIDVLEGTPVAVGR